MDWKKKEEARLLFEKGVTKYEAHDFEGAIIELNKAIEMNPESANAYMARGAARASMKNIHAAIDDFSKAIEISPEHCELYKNRGRAYMQLATNEVSKRNEHIKNAVEDLNKAITIIPDDPMVWYFRGFAKARCKDYSQYQAIDDLSEAIALKPDYADAMLERATCLLQEQNFDAALKDFNNAFEIKEGSAISYLNRGMCFEKSSSDHQAALADFTRAIQLDPEFGDAYARRGYANLCLKHFHNAIRDYDEALKRKSSNRATSLTNRGNAKYKLGEFDSSIEDFCAAIEIDPDNPLIYQGRGVSYVALLKRDLAMADFNRAVELDPQTPQPFLLRGNLKIDMKDYDGAIEDLKKSLQIAPETLVTLNCLSKAFYLKNEFAESRKYIDRILRLDPTCEWAKQALDMISKAEAEQDAS